MVSFYTLHSRSSGNKAQLGSLKNNEVLWLKIYCYKKHIMKNICFPQNSVKGHPAALRGYHASLLYNVFRTFYN